MGIVDNIYLSKIIQINEIMGKQMFRVGISKSSFSKILNQLSENKEISLSKYENQPISTKLLEELPNEEKYEDLIEKAALGYDLDSNLIKAVVRNESRFKKNALSSAGAMGLMQLMPGTAGDLGVTEPFDEYQNVNGGTKYLKTQIDRFGDVRLALAAYNSGPSRVASYNITDPDNDVQYSRIPEKVRNYVDKVLGYYVQYSNQP